MKRYTYSYKTARAGKRFTYEGITYGKSWTDAKANIKKYHPERIDIKRT